MNMRIQQLSPLIASQIAAGEVIERPASVLKELLENSIDSGATRITVTLAAGGVDLIQICDNGCGIVKEDLTLAIAQHATSKIYSIADLQNITSLGFRGEALASIAAISKFEIISKPKTQDIAYKFNNEHKTLQPAAHPDGTTIIVKKIFYNLPARRKFLRSTHTEFNYLEECFKRIVLSNFEIAFILNSDTKTLKTLAACASDSACANRVAAICGKRMLANSVYLNAEQNGMQLSGWLGLPDDARSNTENQYFYLNRRFIKDKVINHALKQAYQEYCAPGRYPNYCLYLTVDPEIVDINVHPTKHEVRFSDPRSIHAFITKVIQQALTQQLPRPLNSDPVIDPSDPEVPKQPLATSRDMVFEPILASVTTANNDANIATMVQASNSSAEVSNIAKADIVANIEPAKLNIDLLPSDAYNDNSIHKLTPIQASATVLQPPCLALTATNIVALAAENRIIILQVAKQLYVIDTLGALKKLTALKLELLYCEHNYIPAMPLATPFSIKVTTSMQAVSLQQDLLQRLGWQYSEFGEKEILLRAVPAPLVDLNVNHAQIIMQICISFQAIPMLKHIRHQDPSTFDGNTLNSCIDLILAAILMPVEFDVTAALNLVQLLWPNAASLTKRKYAPNTIYQIPIKKCEFEDLIQLVYS